MIDECFFVLRVRHFVKNIASIARIMCTFRSGQLLVNLVLIFVLSVL